MRLQSLFTKIFLWFWAANTLVIAALVLTIKLSADNGPHNGLERSIELQCRGALAIKDAQGDPAFLKFLNEMNEETPIKVFWVNEDGREVRGETVPAALLDFARRNQAAVDRGTMVANDGPTRLLALSLKDAHGREQRIYVDCRALARSLRDFTDPRVIPLRVLVVVGAAGLGCYLLARYLTAPVRRLQTAARQLAAGDFSARFGSISSARRDEIGELGREFDRMAGQLETLLATNKQILQDISHELRSPLARLNVSLALVREEKSVPSPELDRMQRESDRLNELIGQILMLSRLESGTIQIPDTSIDLAAMVAEVCADADFEAHRSGRRVEVISSAPIAVMGAAGLIRSAIENVVRNAVRYTSENSAVEVTLSRLEAAGPPGALIQVRDHGAGIPEDKLVDIFRPFHRIAEGRERETGGTGLGLSITYRAILLHGGAVRAANVPTGGLMIEITLPIEQRDKFAVVQQGTATNAMKNGS